LTPSSTEAFDTIANLQRADRNVRPFYGWLNRSMRPDPVI
jgi:hypothetical protein